LCPAFVPLTTRIVLRLPVGSALRRRALCYRMRQGFAAINRGDFDVVLLAAPAAAQRVDALTTNERRVAGMAAAGRSNREIAQALYTCSTRPSRSTSRPATASSGRRA
jgi:ATP/maltotriose-dependent transcriptional regulator MalT